MPIFGLSSTVEEEIISKEDTSIVPHFDSDRIDDAILVDLPGLKWSVTYFNRNISNTDLTTQYDPNLDITLQEYNRYNDFIIHVETPLPSGIPDDLTGEGIIDTTFIPTPNDIFLTKLPDGRIAIFTITGISRINYNNKNLFKITYNIYTAISDINDPVYVKILESIDSEFYYNKDFRLENDKPVIDKNEYHIREKYIKRLDKLVQYWSSMFITSNTNYNMGYAIDDHKYFDIHIEKAILSIIGISNLNSSLEVADISTSELSILDYIINTEYLPSRIAKYKTITTKSSYGTNPYLLPILYNSYITDIITVTNEEDTEIVAEDITLNDIFPKVNNKYYIFRELVYNVINDVSVDENLLTTYEKTLLNMLNGNLIDINDIDTIYENIYSLPVEESFYFIPIYIYIVRYYLTTFTIKFV